MQGLNRRDLHAFTWSSGESGLDDPVINTQVVQLPGYLLGQFASVIEEKNAPAVTCGIFL
jgi:hypothetical protein